MSGRNLRFADTDFKKSPRSYNEPNPCRNIPVPNITVIRGLLETELRNSSLYSSVWSEAKEELQYKKSELPPDFFKSSTPDECYIAVIAYTINSGLYRDFNLKFRMLKTKAAFGTFPYQSFYYLLKLAKEGIKNIPAISSYLYRGIPDIRFNIPPKVSEYFYFDYFASSTIYEEKAQQFMGSKGTMIKLEDGATEGMGIDKYSVFDDEGEVLIFPTNRFQIVGFKREGTVDTLTLRRAGVV